MFGFLKRIFRRRPNRRRGFRVWSVDDAAGGYRIGDLLIRRADVVVIVAFKRDRLTIVQLCLGLGYGEPRADGRYPTAYTEEDNPTYRAVFADLQRHFTLKEGWWEQVIHPAFATNWTTIWSKPEAAGEEPGGAGRPLATEPDDRLDDGARL